MRARGADESGEQRVTVTGSRSELRVELRRHEPRVIVELNHLYQVVTGEARETQPGLDETIQVVVVELVAMAVPLHDDILAEDVACTSPGAEDHLLRAQTHGRTLVGCFIAHLRAACLVLPLGDERNDRVRRRTIELGAVGIGKAKHVAAVLDNGHLHTQADTKVRNAVLTRVACGLDLSLDATLAETAGYQDRIHP